jgi:hypothetical protein
VDLVHSVWYRVLCGSKSTGFLCGFGMKYDGKRVGVGKGVNTRDPSHQARTCLHPKSCEKEKGDLFTY